MPTPLPLVRRRFLRQAGAALVALATGAAMPWARAADEAPDAMIGRLSGEVSTRT